MLIFEQCQFSTYIFFILKKESFKIVSIKARVCIPSSNYVVVKFVSILLLGIIIEKQKKHIFAISVM
jgi:hypothetical protein